jgi:hypothetical protein
MSRNLIALAMSVLVGIAGLVAPALAADLRQFHYVGIHPLPKSEGGGICYIEGPHVHVFDVERKVEYRNQHDGNYFVGDPVAYGYDGPRYAYKGHHPIRVVVDGAPHDEFCYLDGPHFHYFAPPEGPDWKLAGGAYFYVGAPAPAYVEARPAMMRINAVYQPLVYTRPVVAVEAPVGWIGARAEFVGPGAVVVPPRAGVAVEAVVPAPSLQVGIGIGVPGVVVGGPGVVVRERPVVVHERPVIVHERPVVIHERAVVHERPVVVREHRGPVVEERRR